MSQDPNLRQAAILTNTVGQAGCVIGVVALVVIGVAFGAGWLLDSLLGNERKIFTVIFMLGSFPVTLWAMIKISLWMVEKANRSAENIRKQQDQEDKDDNAI
ncbi:MAG: hypothetical protein LC131_17330 [Anaerolineae bacterium]|nr:hypothetical protein [Anaerolineae bacterium]